MKSTKFWVIGTSINSYISIVMKLSSNTNLSRAKFVFEPLKHDKDQFTFQSRNTGEIIFFDTAKHASRATWSQMIRVLLSLGLVKVEDAKSQFISNAEELFNHSYSVTVSNASEVLIFETINSWLISKYNAINIARKNKEFNGMKHINLGLEQYGKNNEDDHSIIVEIYHSIYDYWNENEFLNTLALSIHKSGLFAELKQPSKVEEKFIKILGKNKMNEFYEIDSKYYKITGNNLTWNAKLRTAVDAFIYPSELGTEGKREHIDYIPPRFMVNGLNENAKQSFVDAYAKSFGLFLRDQFYGGIKVPPYQRLYTWNQDLIIGLVNDIDNIEDGKFHYIGGILTSNKNAKVGFLDIVDGQQRVTSMLIILKVIRDYVHRIFDASTNPGFVSEYLETLFMSEKTGKNKVQNLFDLSHNKNSDSFNNIMNSNFNYIPTEDEDKYVQNYDAVEEYISIELEKIINNDGRIKYLFDLQDKAINKTYLSVTINKTNSPFYMFQRLNSSSHPLSDLDLFINFIILSFDEDDYSRNEQNILADIEKYLRMPFSIVKKQKIQEGIIDEKFLNNFMNTFIKYYEVIYVSKFSKEIQKSIKDKQNVRVGKSFNYFKKIIVHKDLGYFENDKLSYEKFNVMVKDICRMVNLFKTLSEKAYLEPTSNLRVLGDLLITFHGRTVYYPIIFYLINKYTSISNNTNEFKDSKKAEFVRQILFALEKYENYFQVISYRGQSMSGAMEFLLNEIMKIDINEKDPFEYVIKILRSKGPFESVGMAMPSDEQFIKFISENKLVSQKVFISLFNRIETYLYLQNGNERKLDVLINSVPKTWTIEHIIPQKPDENYIIDYLSDDKSVHTQSEFKDLHTENIAKIGNILMLSQSINSSASNKPFDYKKNQVYSSDSNLYNLHTYKSQKNTNHNLMSLFEMSSFTFSDIDERSRQLSNLLKEIYRKYK